MKKKYDTDPASTYFGMRLTSCCAAHSTYSMDTGELYCKACFDVAGDGEGDGSEYLEKIYLVKIRSNTDE